MRLSEKQIALIVQKIFDEWKKQQLIRFKRPEAPVIQSVNDAFIENLRAEDRINEEARALLEAHKRKAPDAIDEQKMLMMIKKELAKKYHVII